MERFRRILIISVCFFAISLTLSTFQSCGLLTYDSWICSLEYHEVIDIPDSNLIITIYTNDYCPEAGLKSFDLMQSCYATTKCAILQNHLVESSFHLTFSKDVLFIDDTISTGENLFELLKGNIWYEIIEDDCLGYWVEIEIADKARQRIQYQEIPPDLIFSCMTSDSLNLSVSILHDF